MIEDVSSEYGREAVQRRIIEEQHSDLVNAVP